MKNPALVSSMWKVPFRQVYCSTFKNCLKQTFWCLVVIKVFPHCVDFGSAPVEMYIKNPELVGEHYGFVLKRVVAERLLNDTNHATAQ